MTLGLGLLLGGVGCFEVFVIGFFCEKSIIPKQYF